MKSYALSFFSSFWLHGALGVFLVYSFHFMPPAPPKPELSSKPVIKAVAIDKSELSKQVERIKADIEQKRRAEEQRVRDLEKRAKIAEQKRSRNEDDIKQLNKQKQVAEAKANKAKERQIQEQQKAKKLKEEIVKQEAEKQKAEAQALAAQKKAEAAKKRADDLAKQEAERIKREQEALEKAEQERMMEELAAQELAELTSAKKKHVISETQKYTALIRETIQRNLIVDETMKDKSCKLNIRLAPGGFVTGVKVMGGDNLLCKSAENAVFKAESLPVSEDPDVFAELKNINLTVEPQFE